MKDSKTKMGRPTTSPLIHDVKVRVSEETHKKLLKYCEDNKVNKAEIIRTWIEEKLS